MDPRLHRRVEPEKTSSDTVVEWLNEATITSNDTTKVQNLCKAQEILINKEPNLLNAHLDDVLQFAVDRSSEVKKTVAGFIEEVAEKVPDVIPRVILILLRLITDDAPVVVKRALRTSGKLFKATLKWVSSATVVTADMENVWNQISGLKIKIINMIDSDNDGIRTAALKFLEGVVLVQTYPDPDAPKKPDEFSLDDVPLTLNFARRRKLEEEANHIMELLINFFGATYVSSVNLITCMGSLSMIAKKRPQFMPAVIEALEKLRSETPPTLTDSQVMSVRKHLKLTLFGLLKHPAGIEFANKIALVLTNLGCKENEILKSYPKQEEIRKVKKRQLEQAAIQAAKKAKLEAAMVPIVPDEPEPAPLPVPAPVLPELIELSESYIADRLSVEIATELVMDSMIWVPDSMSSTFSREYQPTATTDILKQRQVIGKLLAVQIKQAIAKKTKTDTKEVDHVMEDLIKNPTISVAEVKRERKLQKDREKEQQAKASLEAHEKSLAKARSRLKSLKLPEVTKPLLKDTRDKMLLMAVKRILASEKDVILGGVTNIRMKILTTLGATFNPVVKLAILDHITEDIRSRLELALSWLYEEYALLQGFQRRTILCTMPKEAPHMAYNTLLCTLIRTIEEVPGRDRDQLLSRLCLSAPLITEELVEMLKAISSEESRGTAPAELLKELVIKRPTKQLVFLNVLLCHTGHENTKVRENAIQLVVELHARPELSKLIEEYAVLYLGFLRFPNPPEIVFGSDRGRPDTEMMWTESTTHACLSLFLALLSKHEVLIHELARIYTSMGADVKRIVLRLVEGPVQSLGMTNQHILQLLESFPKGAETLITRIVHILTERAPPTQELVTKVREIYKTRVFDVRFLIPVLLGLTKKEILEALPKLIKLNPVIVKEVFHKLLGSNLSDSSMSHISPVSPAELLIALHTIDSNTSEDLKTIMKTINLCFAEKQVYTHEVMAVVIQQLSEIIPLPTLLMRTVIQTLALYPRLTNFIMNILQRLIVKQVWKQPKVWEGFVKCCEKTQPQSFAVVMNLPPPQLKEVLRMAPDLWQPLRKHVDTVAETQKAHIPQSIMDVIKGKPAIPMHDEFDIAPPGDFPGERPELGDLDNLEPAPPGLD